MRYYLRLYGVDAKLFLNSDMKLVKITKLDRERTTVELVFDSEECDLE